MKKFNASIIVALSLLGCATAPIKVTFRALAASAEETLQTKKQSQLAKRRKAAKARRLAIV